MVVLAAIVTLFVPNVPHSGTAHEPAGRTAPPPGTVAVDPQFLPTILSSTQPTAFGRFGQSVAVTPSYVVVGAPAETADAFTSAGAAYIENLTNGAMVRLVSPNPQTDGDFGYTVAAAGGLVLIGAPGESWNGATSAGSAYLFSSSGSLLQTLTSPNGQLDGDFGDSVGIAGNYAVVGAPFESISGYPSCGGAYLINLQTDAYRLLISPYPELNANFGASVSISDNFVAVGAPYDSTGGASEEGAVYVFAVPTGNMVERIVNPDSTPSGFFGFSVAISGTIVVGGAPDGNSPTISGSGVVFEINMITNGTTPIYSPSPLLGGFFGGAVAVDSETIVAGAELETSGGQLMAGNAYLFGVQSGGQVSSAFSAPGWPYNGRFGISVAESGTTVVVGANLENASGVDGAGHAYVFDQIPLRVVSYNPTAGGRFGASVAVDGGVFVAGAPDEPVPGYAEAGNVYVVPIDVSPNLAEMTLSSPNPAIDGWFGYSVATSGNLIVVGAPGESPGGSSGQGRVYVFNESTLSLYRTWTTPTPTAGANFGFSVSISGNLVAVGAPGVTVGGDANAGAAYVFSVSTGAQVTSMASGSPAVGGEFGSSISINGALTLVGAPGESVGAGTGAGHAYLDSSTTGTTVASFQSPNAAGGAAFGASVSLAGTVAVVGAPYETVQTYANAGRAYEFSTATDSLVATLISSQVQQNAEFGFSVWTTGSTIVVGAPGDTSVGMLQAGAIYLYNTGTGIMDRFYSPNVFPGAGFGNAVADGGTRIAVGASSEGAGHSTGIGGAYVFGFETTPLL